MPKKHINKNFIDEINSSATKRKYETMKIVYNRFDEIWSIDIADFSDYKTSNYKGFRSIFVIIDNFSKNLWAIPLKNEYSETITKDFSSILTKSKRNSLKIESNRGTEFYESIFQIFLKSKTKQHYSRFTDKNPSIAERVIRTIHNLI